MTAFRSLQNATSGSPFPRVFGEMKSASVATPGFAFLGVLDGLDSRSRRITTDACVSFHRFLQKCNQVRDALFSRFCSTTTESESLSSPWLSIISSPSTLERFLDVHLWSDVGVSSLCGARPAADSIMAALRGFPREQHVAFDLDETTTLFFPFSREQAPSAEWTQWMSLDAVSAFLLSEGPSRCRLSTVFSEESLWKFISIGIGCIEVGNTLGVHYFGDLKAADVLVRWRFFEFGDLGSHCEVEYRFPPPFALALPKSRDGTQGFEAQSMESVDVLSLGKIVATLMAAVEDDNQPMQRIASPALFSAELTFLAKKLLGASDGSVRPTAHQITQFHAVKLRCRQWLLAEVADASRQFARKLPSVAESTRSSLDDRQRMLDEREAKLQAFLELYELTTVTLDSLPITKQNTQSLKDLLHETQTLHSSKQSAVVNSQPQSVQASRESDSQKFSRPCVLQQVDFDVTDESDAQLAQLDRNVVSPVQFVTDVSVLHEVAVASVPPVPPVPYASLQVPSVPQDRQPCRTPSPTPESPHVNATAMLNDSVEVEVIEVELDDEYSKDPRRTPTPQSSAPSQPTAAFAQPTRHRRHQGSTSGFTSAWMDSHVAQLDRMQQQLKGHMRLTPPKDNVAHPRRSPSAGRHGHRSVSLQFGASADTSSVVPPSIQMDSYDDDDIEAREILYHLRRTVAVE